MIHSIVNNSNNMKSIIGAYRLLEALETFMIQSINN